MLMIKLVDARKGLHEKCVELFHNEKVAESIYMYLCDGIEECDAVEPERMNGEWERKSFYDSTPICSECGIEGRWDFEYCPYCGADMRGEQDESD